MTSGGMVFNPPPGWPKPPIGWTPPAGWTPDPSWPAAPPGWLLWLDADDGAAPGPSSSSEGDSVAPMTAETLPANASEVQEARIHTLEQENARLRERLAAGDSDALIELDDARVLQAVGIYRFHHPLETAAAYKERLNDIETRIADVVRDDQAIEKSELFTFNNSLAQGRRMTSDLARLMLRAYNAEADNALRTLRAGNAVTATRRLEASRVAIAKLGKLMEMRISDAFHLLRVEEIELTADWLMKKQVEREEAREERARLREEQRVQKELDEERSRLDKERAHLLNALSALTSQGQTDDDLLHRLATIEEAIADNDFRAANIRAGYVYVISNEGAFGPGVVKIGLTRRLKPTERINELSGASVPFRFDVHTLFFSEDAVTLENELHRHFADRALNQTNSRKEFFFATPSEVREVLLSKVGNLLEFSDAAEAVEFRQSVASWPKPSHGRHAIS
ncbi:T5orf172 domain protein [Clavibacter michiganensis]|nr:T5orf172 domain protein [Clavibacter michiganensis]